MNRVVSVVIVGFVLAGCTGGGPAERGGESSTATAAIATEELSRDQQRQQQVALAARDELFQALSQRLAEVLADAGPAAAISVCKSDAPRLATEIGQQYGVAIGRTSHRLRNPQNAPPAWARPLVEREVAEASFVPLPEKALGVLLPIRLKSNCLLCHGPREQIVPQVQEALAEEYPQDQATGFAEDELRGWFWVEVRT
jgi:hypothetical protein